MLHFPISYNIPYLLTAGVVTTRKLIMLMLVKYHITDSVY